MKALVLQTVHFKLPDDFAGTLSDALRLLADYHDSMTGSPLQTCTRLEDTLAGMSFKAANVALFEQFLDAINNGRRLVGTVQLVSYNPKPEEV